MRVGTVREIKNHEYRVGLTPESVRELVSRIEHFVKHYNTQARPFVWTATAESILEKVERLCKVINGTGH